VLAFPSVEVGWRLAHEAWGQAYPTEGARAALRVGFEQAGLDEIVSFTVPANVRSRAVMERLGMTHDTADDPPSPGPPRAVPDPAPSTCCGVSRTVAQAATGGRPPDGQYGYNVQRGL
jgi:hypothetical protein